MDRLTAFLIELGLDRSLAEWAALAAALVAILVAAALADWVARRIILRAVRSIAARSDNQWDDALVAHRVPSILAHLVPVLIVSWVAPIVLERWPRAQAIVDTSVLVAIVFLIILTINALLNAILTAYDGHPVSRRFPIRTIVQAIKLIGSIVGIILILSLLVGRSPLYFLSGIGALSAVLLIVFKDSILGFVAGIQLTANNMVTRGDWIEMPSYGADGNVLEVSLTTVKVQNWDKTITTIPTYALISDSFKNWRGMEESGGRRIKRSIAIDMTSVRICDDAMIDRFRKFAFISDYMSDKSAELEAWNADHPADPSQRINGRRMTNLGTFRAYVQAYLRSLPHLRDDMTFLVRQLAPGPQGIPIEIYVFTREQRWVPYEGLQADIFDHIIAVIPEFELRVFQHPTGQDLARSDRPVTTPPE